MGKAEGIVENYLRRQCKKYDIFCCKFTSPGTRGVPDEILIYQGETYFVETKSPVGDTSAIQKVRIAQMKNHGAKVFVCHTRQKIDQLLASIVPNYQSEPNTHQKQDTPKRTSLRKPEPPVKRKPIRLTGKEN